MKTEEKKTIVLKNEDPQFLQIIQKLRPIDNQLMDKIFIDIPCTELLLKIILNRNDLIVKSVRTEYSLKNLEGRSVRLDILAIDQNEKSYNIEVQRNNKGAVIKRARYHSSIMDTNVTVPGEDYEKLPETYVIFITENDIFRKGLPIYHIERIIQETGEKVNDEAHIIYVNSTIQNETALGKLMQDFFCQDPNKMNYEVLAKRTKFYKETEEGIKEMSEEFQKYMNEELQKHKNEWKNEGKKEQSKEMALRLAAQGVSLEIIAEAAECNVETVQNWIYERKQAG